jgi:hypothetical protein
MAQRRLVVALFCSMMVATVGDCQAREQNVLETAIHNSLRSVKSLSSLFFEQAMTSKWRVHEYGADRRAVVNPERQLVEKFETVIADGKVFARCTERNGNPVDEKSRLLAEQTENDKPAEFLQTVLFGSGIPFEVLPAEFKVVDEQRHKGRMLFGLQPINKKGEFKAVKVVLEIDEGSMRVLTAKYHISPNPQYISREVELRFGSVPVTGYRSVFAQLGSRQKTSPCLSLQTKSLIRSSM